MTHEDDWHEWRRQGIGGSDIAPILGLSPYAGPWQIWAQKTGLLPPQEANTAMEFGRRAEQMIARWFTDLTGLWVAGAQTQCQHPTHDWARCTVDGYVSEYPRTITCAAAADDVLGVLESKTAGYALWDEIPAHYQAQAQWQMFVTGLDHVWMPVLHGKRLHIYELDRDNADIDWMLEQADNFLHRYVLTGKPPEPTSHDLDALHTRYPDSDEHATAAIPFQLADEYKRAVAVVRLAEQRRDDLKARILEQAGEAGTIYADGQVAFTLRTQTRRGNIDRAALKADGINPDKYRKPDTTYRVLRSTGDT